MNIKINILNNTTNKMEELVIPDGDQLPRIIDGQTYVPLRYTFEKMGYNIAWESKTHYVGSNPKGTVTITNSAGNRIIVKEGLSCFTTNGMEFENLNKVNNIAVGGRILMPVRGILESIGCTVEWNKLSATEAEVNIRTNLEGYYRIKNNSGKYLTYVKSSEPASNNAIQVMEASNEDNQIWKIERPSPSNGMYHIKPAAYDGYGLNIYRISSYPCTIQPIQGNVADTSFYITCVSGYKYTIAWENSSSTRYLSDDGTKTSWSSSNSHQEWTLEETEYSNDSGNSGDTTERKIIDLPNDRTYNWNQYYSAVHDAINSYAGCSWTCALDVANIYGPTAYEPSDMPPDAWDAYWGCYWYLPEYCIGHIEDYTILNNDTEKLNIIRDEINHNRPVIVELHNDNCNPSQHFVVAYGYKNDGKTKSDILVLDPGVGHGSESDKEGLYHTLADAEIHNGNKGFTKPMSRLRLTTGR